MRKNINVSNNIEDAAIQLISKEEVDDQFGEAIASTISTDQVVSWAKFILTDDKPNKNGQRIPIEEFDNIIKTGTFKPVKMAIGEINNGHDDAKPLGVITNLIQEDNKIIALAALWNHERTDDVLKIKGMLEAKKPVNFSWEVLYGNLSVKDGISNLRDIILTAVTIVGMPAYAGRTQLIAVASSKWNEDYMRKLSDESFMYIDSDSNRFFAYRDDTGKIDPSRFPVILNEMIDAPIPQNTLKNIRHQITRISSMIRSDASVMEVLGADGDDLITEDTLDIKELEGKVTDLEAKLAKASELLVEKDVKLSEALTLVSDAEKTVGTLEGELAPLRDFKAEADKNIERESKLSAIKEKFNNLNLAKDEAYFEENADKLLGLDDSGLDFMLQEMVAFKDDGKGTGTASTKKTTSGVPNLISSSQNISADPVKLAQALTELRKSNKK